eukprot:m.59601 g.59601  ORF g.59601 m.59601 type:complete len:549 (+) comp9470_c0_seq1:528-2174(+)
MLAFTAFTVLLVPRLVGSAVSHITDCDEVFNYWEPLHYLLHGTGLQTWEYSPEYALRSYFYLLWHGWPSSLLTQAGYSDKVLAFYVTRAVLGVVSAGVEARLCAAVARSKAFGERVAWVLLVFLTVAPGMLHASVALLPSSTSMLLCTLAFAAWIDRDFRAAIVCIAASTLLVWPFSGALGVPIALDLLLREQQWLLFVGTSLGSLALFLGSSVYVDSGYYGRPAIAGLNIVLYNVLSGDTSSELYGTEPWSFYFINGALNLSVAFALGLLGPAAAVLRRLGGVESATSALLYLSPIAVWVAIFFPQAHKEERFLFPIYPLLCLAGAATLVWGTELCCSVVSKVTGLQSGIVGTLRKGLPIVAVLVFCALSVSRGIATHRAYHAPLDVYHEVATLKVPPTGLKICVGKEWYRFASSFFLPPPHPSGGVASLEFIKSGYDGLLPKPFAAVNGTSAVPTAMNNMNREEPSRYVPIETCDYVVDRDGGAAVDHEPRFTHSPEGWGRVVCRPFLDTGNTPALFRAFYIPTVSEKRTAFVDYCLLERKRSTPG